MQIFNATNVVLNSIRLATPSVKMAGGEGGSFRRLEKFCAELRRDSVKKLQYVATYPSPRGKYHAVLLVWFDIFIYRSII